MAPKTARAGLCLQVSATLCYIGILLRGASGTCTCTPLLTGPPCAPISSVTSLAMFIFTPAAIAALQERALRVKVCVHNGCNL